MARCHSRVTWINTFSNHTYILIFSMHTHIHNLAYKIACIHRCTITAQGSQVTLKWENEVIMYLLSGCGLVADQHLLMGRKRESHIPSIHVQGQCCPQHLLWRWGAQWQITSRKNSFLLYSAWKMSLWLTIFFCKCLCRAVLPQIAKLLWRIQSLLLQSSRCPPFFLKQCKTSSKTCVCMYFSGNQIKRFWSSILFSWASFKLSHIELHLWYSHDTVVKMASEMQYQDVYNNTYLE